MNLKGWFGGTKGKLSYFFLSLIVLILLTPINKLGFWGGFFINIMFILVLLFGLYVVSEKKEQMYTALLLGAPWILVSWLVFIFPPSGIEIPASYTIISLSITLFYVYVSWNIWKHITAAERINLDILAGALSVYLMIAILFSMIFFSIGRSYPDAFDDPVYDFDFADSTYYSFVTITTLGYGDITPVNPGARILSAMEAVIGVLYMAITIAMFVGLYKPEPKKK